MTTTVARAESWTYASGRVAALEDLLLPPESLERLADADSARAAASALAESPLRSAVAEARSPAEAAAAVAAYYSGAISSIRADCPHPELFKLIALPARFSALKARVREAVRGGAELDSEKIAELLGDFAPQSEAAAGLELLASVISSDAGPETGLALDLTLDSARLLESLRLAGHLDDADVRDHVRDEVEVRSTLFVWRSRLVAAGQENSPAERWLPRLFLRGELASGLAGRLLDSATSEWGNPLAEELTLELGGEAAFGAGEKENVAPWERAAFDWLTARARLFRGQAFGVARVYGYAWALAVEERNVRLALVGRLRGVAPGAVKDLLWERC